MEIDALDDEPHDSACFRKQGRASWTTFSDGEQWLVPTESDADRKSSVQVALNHTSKRRNLFRRQLKLQVKLGSPIRVSRLKRDREVCVPAVYAFAEMRGAQSTTLDQGVLIQTTRNLKGSYQGQKDV